MDTLQGYSQMIYTETVMVTGFLWKVIEDLIGLPCLELDYTQ